MILRSREGKKPCEVDIAVFTTADGSSSMAQQEVDTIPVNEALPKGDEGVSYAFDSFNVKWLGKEKDFRELGDAVAQRFRNTCPLVHEVNNNKSKKPFLRRLKNFQGKWLPGNFFLCRISEQLCRKPERRKELDNHWVVLLPSADSQGALDLHFQGRDCVLVAVLDRTHRSTYRVPCETLHPGGVVENCQKEFEQWSSERYKQKVLVWDEIEPRKPRQARLCVDTVGRDACRVEFEDSSQRDVNIADVGLDDSIRSKMKALKDGQDGVTIVPTEPNAPVH